MDISPIMEQLQLLGTARTKKMYISSGAQEPVFGVATGAMKPIAKAHQNDQQIANALYATNNYDAMYVAGMIASVDDMTVADFERWMDGAYFYMLSDYVVAVTLAESALGQQIADLWIQHSEPLHRSAGWSCYCWMLGNQKDDQFDAHKLAAHMALVEQTIHDAPADVQASMINFITTVGVSFLPLHTEAYATAQRIGSITIQRAQKKPSVLHAAHAIEKEIERGRIGFKRKHVRC